MGHHKRAKARGIQGLQITAEAHHATVQFIGLANSRYIAPALIRGGSCGGRSFIRAGAVALGIGRVVAGRQQRAAQKGTGKPRRRPTPAPTSAPPLHRFYARWRRIAERKSARERHGGCNADGRHDAGRHQCRRRKCTHGFQHVGFFVLVVALARIRAKLLKLILVFVYF